MFSLQGFGVDSIVKKPNLYCVACLSTDRTLTSLCEYIDIFYTISNCITKMSSEDTLLCWECMAMLKKIKSFKDKVCEAQNNLNSSNQSIEKHKSLSSLRIQEANNIIALKYEEDKMAIKQENTISNQVSDDDIPLSNVKYNDLKTHDAVIYYDKENNKNVKGVLFEVKKEIDTHDDSVSSAKCDEMLSKCDAILKDDEMKTEVKNQKYSKNNRNVKGPSKYHKVVICDHCGKKYKSKRVLEKHVRNHSTTHLCTICDITFKTKATLRKHTDIKHVTVNTEDAYCVPCDIQFNNVKVYKRHVNTSIKHAKERNGKMSTTKVPCPECGNIYSRKAYMMNHYNHVHRNDSKYHCVHCDRKFLNRTKYLDHTKYYHEGKKKEKNKLCYICGRGFAIKRTLINHIRTHSGERPYQCQHCGNRFVQKHAMLTHVKHLHNKTNDGCRK
ncbi:hypothetical protein K1T71_000706 [Dendrolimus kikuchii]|uniref:Uncharacterized protein n=1 Tax=Dendrolimus kikuchii TaxID=765133 RepID=A0ACC1DJZ6_9NEOP|nr:hypothetical protein K1T71_000706 [Dendrolimus kikuchii]